MSLLESVLHSEPVLDHYPICRLSARDRNAGLCYPPNFPSGGSELTVTLSKVASEVGSLLVQLNGALFVEKATFEEKDSPSSLRARTLEPSVNEEESKNMQPIVKNFGFAFFSDFFVESSFFSFSPLVGVGMVLALEKSPDSPAFLANKATLREKALEKISSVWRSRS